MRKSVIYRKNEVLESMLKWQIGSERIGVCMEWLKQDELLVTKNNNQAYANRKKSITVYGNILLYKLDNLSQITLPPNYIVDFENYKVYLFTLETLREIISILEKTRQKGIKKPIVFCSSDILVFSDDLTVSMTEYVIYYYYVKYGINAYITHAERTGSDMQLGLTIKEKMIQNGFFYGEAGRGFFRDSFLAVRESLDVMIAEDDFFARHESSNRFKKIVGEGPWDSSIAISECSAFLSNAKVSQNAIDAVADVIGELAPNAIEHGKTNCMIDVCYERSTSPEGKDYTSISLVVYDFSEKLLWSDLYNKIFVNSEEITQKRQRIDTVKKAWIEHRKYFSKEYSEEDFYNLMAFQKISGRAGDRYDGGLGISTLVEKVRRYSDEDECYALSGNGAMHLQRELTIPDSDGFIAFNVEQQFVYKIPDKDGVLKTRFFMPGVAYNMIFYFEEVEDGKDSNKD